MKVIWYFAKDIAAELFWPVLIGVALFGALMWVLNRVKPLTDVEEGCAEDREAA